uniref:AMMECR1 domain-containing protein n=1 Tax=Panagrolaimus sp. JU765 TaxID=591449 RepID=A0AC34PYA0_9BILA
MVGADIEMTAYCFDVVIAKLRNHSPPTHPPTIPKEKHPLFVTWKKGKRHELRGCIGTFSRDLALPKGLADYAEISAFRDSRFSPITIEEIPNLRCAVSILIKFEPATHVMDWIVGIHGIRIEFRQNGRRLSSVYLPEVAAEQGWNHIETLDHLMRKGGFEGPIYESDRKAVSIERFQSTKVMMSFDEYCSFKKNQGIVIPPLF